MDQVTIDLAGAGQWQAVEERCRRMLKGGDAPPIARLFLAVALCREGRTDEGCQFLRQFLALEPSSGDAWRNLGMVRFNQNALDTAVRSVGRAIAISAEDKDAWVSLGTSLYLMSRFENARSSMKRAVALFPEDESLRSRLFYPLHRLAEREDHGRMLPIELFSATSEGAPAWRGESLRGRTILVWCGANGSLACDIIFSSMIPDLIAGGAQVVFECEPRLVELLARSFPQAHFVPYIGRIGSSVVTPFPVDCQVYSRKLQTYCRPTLQSFASTHAYLKADPREVAYWRTRLAALGPEPKVGISWRSGVDYNRPYSLALNDFAPILKTPGVRFVNIQYTDCRAELAAIRDELGVDITNFEEIDITSEVDRSAALMTGLDLVISSENTSEAIACAVGVPSFCIVPDVVINSSVLPWFPLEQRFTKAWNEPWAVPVAAASAALRRWLSSPSPTRPAPVIAYAQRIARRPS